MPRPTLRGAALLGVALATFVAARTVGTWELYWLATAMLAVVAASWAFVLVSGRGVTVTRKVSPVRPVAGDLLRVTCRVSNHSLLPGVQVTLAEAAGPLAAGDGPLEMATPGPRSARSATTEPRPARRGVFALSAPALVLEDPLGLVRARRQAGGALDFVVPPRLVALDAAAIRAGTGARLAGRGRRLPAPDALELRSSRPYLPGEPLQHVDWKATARTGRLMLRETEDGRDGGVTVLLQAAAADVAGAPPETNFELAVQAAGSLADGALRAGSAVSLVLPGDERHPVRLAADAASRARLRELLAAAGPGGPPAAVALRSLAAARPRGGSRRPPTHKPLAIVLAALDRDTVRALVELSRAGAPLLVVLAAADSFGRAAPAEGESLRLSLLAAGVRVVSVDRGEDLRAAFAAPPAARRALRR